MLAGIYARISRDADDTRLGVERQIADCRELAERKEWEVAETFVDNDVSASRSKVRPEYQRMMQAVEDGRIQAIVVWDVDRLTRKPRELEDVIDLTARSGVELASVGGEIDLATPQGKMTAGIKGMVARHESEQQARRIRRKFEQKAAAGEPHSHVPYGYLRVQRDGAPWEVPDPEAGPVVQEMVSRFIRGDWLHTIARDFNVRGVRAPRGGDWNNTLVRQIVRRPINAGFRVFRGEVAGRANCDPLISGDEHEQVLAILADPVRKANYKGREPRSLLTGIAGCGLCGGKMRKVPGAIKAGKKQPAAYSCRDCHRVRRKLESVDDLVTVLVLGRLLMPDLAAAMAGDNSDQIEKFRAQVVGLEARLELAADEFADGGMTGDQLRRVNAKILPQLEELRRRLASLRPVTAVLDLAGEDAAERWAAATLDIRRSVVEDLMEITILPTGSGIRFSPEHIKIEWKVPAA
ncbi:recombinase family protein [Arthrobacter sp. 179]|uniref:recombinase family protein n=1 Tax=Arthrobacter sp. 179 TaxID=3457734 RepID=UPI0040332341